MELTTEAQKLQVEKQSQREVLESSASQLASIKQKLKEYKEAT